MEFSHGGVDEGFEAFWVGFSDGRGIAVMTNGDRGTALAMEVVRSVAREYGWAEYAPIEREIASVDPKVYAGYAGEFEIRVNPQVTVVLGVSADGGKLLVQQNGGEKREWLPASETEFFSATSGNVLVFTRDAKGVARELTLRQGGESYTGKRIK